MGAAGSELGLGAFQVAVEFGDAVVRLLGRRAAAVRHVVEVPGGGAQSVGVGGQGPAGFGGCLVGGAAGADVEECAFLQGTDEGPRAFLDGLVPVALGGVCLGGGAVVGGAAGAVVEQGGGRGGPAARGAQAPPQGAQDREDRQDDDDQAECAAGCRGRGGVEQFAEPVPEGVEGALEQAGVVLVVHPLGQLASGRLTRGVAWGGEGRLVGGARRRQYGGVGGVQQCSYGGAW
ncbi:hypothetical protein [Streptomyces sp. CA-179760]|uniref:hypothetical protein n=1 Tax=Streptomyces sp. CA-179760 TaxID=3240054 RepID=UPI003D90D32E